MTNSIQFIDHAPFVRVIGQTHTDYFAIHDVLNYRNEEWNTDEAKWIEQTDPDSEAIAEFAGRTCYMSFSNPAKRSREAYLQEQIVAHKHESVIEHVVLNFYCADLPRSTQLELVRHRVGVAYSFESTRFTNKHVRFVIPPRLRDITGLGRMAQDRFRSTCVSAFETYQALRSAAESEDDEGTLKRKRALEAARSVLPNCLGSDGVVSINARELRHIVSLRTSEAADLSIREFAFELYKAAKGAIPMILADAILIQSEHVPIVRFGGIDTLQEGEVLVNIDNEPF